MQTDFLVIGSGIAGLTYAVKVAEAFPDKDVLILTKTSSDETNTKYAQGGIAGVWDAVKDSYEKHIEDTIIAGDGLCHAEVVEIVVKEGPDRIREIIEWGANFDKDDDGDYSLGREGGHSEYRILHHKDITGFEMERALLSKVASLKNIRIINHVFVLDLITQHHLGYLVMKTTLNIECFGVYVLNQETMRIEKILARHTLLATGGNGSVYRTTTNPSIATGDGVAMVYRAKGRVENMEFIQFHPTALYEAGLRGQAFLITEAVRGDGGILRNHKGEAFMEKYDERKDLAPRDIVARAIDNEMKINGTEHVFLDCRQMDIEKFVHHFPNIYEKCKSIGINVAKQMIPVAPAAHYSCGGVKADKMARTTIKNLYAAGECASTGLHGANRLASNSLLEAMVFAHRAFLDVAGLTSLAQEPERLSEEGAYSGHEKLSGDQISATSKISPLDPVPNLLLQGGREIPDWDERGTTNPREMILITQSLKELQLLMSDYVGIVRNNVRLERASRRLDLLYEEIEDLYKNTSVSPQLCELRNMITVGYLIVKGAQFRQESRGLHFNTDFPEKNALVQDIVL
jgi:L-aspartate oxidase